MMSKLEKNRRIGRRKMDGVKFRNAMKKRGIDSKEVVRKANLKRKGIKLSTY